MIYTAGYREHTLQQLCTRVEELHAKVLDVRYFPRSRRPEWQQKALMQALGKRYAWVRAWGNVNYAERKPIELYDFETGFKAFTFALKSYENIILLCGCPDAQTCHRSVIADRLRGLACEVEELDW